MDQPLSPFKKAIVSFISWYGQSFPIDFGKAKLQRAVLKILGIRQAVVTTREGNKLLFKFPEDRAWETAYFRGTYETGTTDLLKKILQSDDVVIDIGANVGWYTVLISKIVSRGHCFAVEPVPMMFQRAQENCRINGLTGNVTLSNLALGEKDGSVELYTFKNLPHGYSSLSSQGRSEYTVSHAEMITLDHYLERERIGKLDLIKIDVEGAELSVLHGASGLLSRQEPPMWIMEMNKETAASFGHAPQELLAHLQSFGEYKFFRVVHAWGETLPMRSITDYEHGDNVLCVPVSRLGRVKI